jgi:hypothetical protein
MPAGHRSQSEADWAFAKRALARGDDPEEIIQRIADYRAEDKGDPLYYARHTVERAERQFTTEKCPNHALELLQRNSPSPAVHEIQDRS